MLGHMAMMSGSAERPEIVFTTTGATFEPLVVLDTALYPDATVLWTDANGSTYSIADPTIEYGSAATRETRLQVTPWAALLCINLGYDGDDGADTSAVVPDLFDIHDTQDVTAITGLEYVRATLVGLACSRTQIVDLRGLRGCTAFQRLEYFCDEANGGALNWIDTSGCTALRRLCIERAALDETCPLDLRDSPIEDLRAAFAAIGGILYPPVVENQWHNCTRETPLGNESAPPFGAVGTPAMKDILMNNTGLSGELDLSFVTPTRYAVILCGANDITSVVLGDSPGGMYQLDLNGNSLPQEQVDAILVAIAADTDRVTTSIDLSGNTAPSATGIAAASTLTGAGVSVTVDS